MNPDDFKKVWQTETSQTRLTIDAGLALEQVRRKQKSFTAMIFWRDVREIGVALLMVPLWFYLGVKQSSPWTWYLTVPVLLWIPGYMLADRIRHKRQSPEPHEPLRQHVESSLAQVEQQIRLLRNVFWWALLPLAVAMLAFFGQGAWQERSGGWWTVLAFSTATALGLVVLAIVYGLNVYAVRCELEPRRRELETLRMSLDEEAPDAGGTASSTS